MNMKGIFSEGYNEYLKRRDYCRRKVQEAIEEIQGATIMGEKVDTQNPEEVIATLYVLYKEYHSFHE
jgi:hypothetical protein